MAGIHLAKPFPLFPHGFPPEIMDEFETRIGRSSLGNKAASGTEIIQELGAEHMRTGSPIVYTSADSVFQVAAHEEVIPLWELYKICETAREILRGPYEVGRVIARPFIGCAGQFHAHRQSPRLRRAAAQGHAARSTGRARRRHPQRRQNLRRVPGARHSRIDQDQKQRRRHGGDARSAWQRCDDGLIFVNLVDFDQQYGHRNDIAGYGSALEEFDAWLPQLESAMRPDDLAIFTADHGCDPTVAGTDHTREYVPLLAFGPNAQARSESGRCARRFPISARPWRKISARRSRTEKVSYRKFYEKTCHGGQLEDVQDARRNHCILREISAAWWRNRRTARS